MFEPMRLSKVPTRTVPKTSRSFRRLRLYSAVPRAVFELALARLAHRTLTPAQICKRNQVLGKDDEQPAFAVSTVELVGWTIPRVANRLPWRADCLIQAAAAQRWLAAKGINSAITIDIKKKPGGEFIAHAWLKFGDHVVTGGNISGYNPLLTPDQTPR